MHLRGQQQENPTYVELHVWKHGVFRFKSHLETDKVNNKGHVVVLEVQLFYSDT